MIQREIFQAINMGVKFVEVREDVEILKRAGVSRRKAGLRKGAGVNQNNCNLDKLCNDGWLWRLSKEVVNTKMSE